MNGFSISYFRSYVTALTHTYNQYFYSSLTDVIQNHGTAKKPQGTRSKKASLETNSVTPGVKLAAFNHTISQPQLPSTDTQHSLYRILYLEEF